MHDVESQHFFGRFFGGVYRNKRGVVIVINGGFTRINVLRIGYRFGLMTGFRTGFRTGFTDALASLACPRQAAWQKTGAK